MFALTDKNTIVLPETTGTWNAPSCFSDDLWFESKKWDPSIDRFDADIIDALITKGIGNRKCPTDGENAAFCIVGGIIASITGKYLIFSEKTSRDIPQRANEHCIWEILWNVAECNKERINTSFLASVLRSFLPRQHDPLIDRPYYESHFVTRWRHLAYPISFSRDLQCICPEHIERGKEALDRLPVTSASSVKKAARHIPAMLTIFTGHMCL